jgi:hypothetical protein
MAPLVSACTVGWSSRPDRALTCSIAEATAPERSGVAGGEAGPGHFGVECASAADLSSGVVVLSVEPAVLAPACDTETPVVFPGYVLPDDSLEGRAHEGS